MTLSDKPAILVVEDDEATAKLIRLVLEYEGFEVRHAADGLEAKVFITSQWAPALVTLDLELPHVKGEELMMQIKTTPGWERVPVIMITATRKTDAAWAVRKGAKGHLTKPFEPEDLLKAVRRLLPKKAS